MQKRSMRERVGDSWDVLTGLKRVATRTASPGSDRVGSRPGMDNEILQSLSQPYQFFKQRTHLEPDRTSIYDDMDEMFQYVLAMGAMDAYVEDASQPDVRKGTSVWVKSQNPRVRGELEKLLENLEIEERCAADLYQIGKYGDHFGLLMYDKEKGIFDVREIEPRICWRHEDISRVLEGFTIGEISPEANTGPKFKPWDMVHFRNRGRRPTDAYGSPMFLNVRLVYKTLKLMEEQMSIYRMNMHPDRLLFKIYTGTASPDERRRIISRWRKGMESTTSIDHQRGRFVSEYSPWCLVGDTKVKLADGTSVTMLDLVDKGEGYEFEVPAYDIETKSIVTGNAHSARLVVENTSVVKIVLDNKETIVCTPEHKFMLANEEYLEAGRLFAGALLMSEEGAEITVISVNVVEEKQDVYCFTVDEYHNFALAAGVMTHNSIDQNIYWPIGKDDNVSGVDKMPGCFTGDTKISLLDGTEVAIKDLVGVDEFYTYSCTPDGEIKPGRGHSARVMRHNSELVAVTIDSGERVRCTPDHKFMRRDGTWCEAQHLKRGDSLMPLYRKIPVDYEYVRDNKSKKWVPTHRMVAEGHYGKDALLYDVAEGEDYNIVHHAFFNKRNNDPRDLQIMGIAEHSRFHTENLDHSIHSPESKAKAAEAVRLRYSDPVWREEKRKQQSSLMSAQWEDPEIKAKMIANIAKTGKVTGTKNITLYNKCPKKRAKTAKLMSTTQGFSSKETQAKIHTPERRAARSKRLTEYNLANREAKSKHMKLIHRWRRETKMSLPFAEWKAGLGLADAPNNHKVVSVKWLKEREDVYDITVDKYHNFVISDGKDCGSGIIVSNSSNAGDLFDIRYVRDLFFAGTRVPKAYMGFEDSRGYMWSDTLSQQDIKFSRGVRKLQRAYLLGLTRVAKIHLVLRGINPNEMGNDFSLEMTPVNNLQEQQKAELMTKRMESVQYLLSVGEQMSETLGMNAKTWATYVLYEYGGLDQHTIARMLVKSTDDTPDVTYAATGSVFNFEHMDPAMRVKLEEKLLDDPDLKGLLDDIIPDEDIHSSATSVNSRAERTVLPNKTELKEHASLNKIKESYDLSSSQPSKRAEQEKKGRKEELKRIIEEMQGEYSGEE